MDVQRGENLSPDAILALFAPQANGLVRIGSMLAVKFKQRGPRPGSSHFVQIWKDATARLGNSFQCVFHLFVAVTCGRAEDMSGKTVRLNANEHVFAVFDIPFDECDMRLLIENAFE